MVDIAKTRRDAEDAEEDRLEEEELLRLEEERLIREDEEMMKVSPLSHPRGSTKMAAAPPLSTALAASCAIKRATKPELAPPRLLPVITAPGESSLAS